MKLKKNINVILKAIRIKDGKKYNFQSKYDEVDNFINELLKKLLHNQSIEFEEPTGEMKICEITFKRY